MFCNMCGPVDDANALTHNQLHIETHVRCAFCQNIYWKLQASDHIYACRGANRFAPLVDNFVDLSERARANPNLRICFCGSEFEHSNQLSIHQQRKITIKCRKRNCLLCGKPFGSVLQLLTHVCVSTFMIYRFLFSYLIFSNILFFRPYPISSMNRFSFQ